MVTVIGWHKFCFPRLSSHRLHPSYTFILSSPFISGQSVSAVVDGHWCFISRYINNGALYFSSLLFPSHADDCSTKTARRFLTVWQNIFAFSITLLRIVFIFLYFITRFICALIESYCFALNIPTVVSRRFILSLTPLFINLIFIHSKCSFHSYANDLPELLQTEIIQD